MAWLASTLMTLRPSYVNVPVQIFDVLGGGKAEMLLRLLKLFGISLLFWTVNTPEDLCRVAPYARAIVTDDVGWAVAEQLRKPPASR